MSDLASRLAGLSPKKRELLLRQLASRQPGGERPAADRIPRLPRDGDRFPVSFSQLREWILDRLQPGTGAYNLPGGGRVVGPLDRAVLERAVGEIVRRHEVLRTTFADGRQGGGEPEQVIAPRIPLEIPLLDLSGLPDGRRREAERRLSREELAAGFDLGRGPLLRVRLVRLSAEEHLVLFTMHHVVSDGWSMGVFFRELAALYAAFLEGRPSPLPELPVQYADYSVWQRSRLEGEGLTRQLDYWRRQLAGVTPLELPTDRPRPPVQRFDGGKARFTLPPEPSNRLRELCRQHGASLFMGLLAAFAALLGRWSHQDDLTVGTYSGNRDRAELEGLVGFFINTLVLRVGLAGSPTFEELLGRAREVTLEAFAHQDVPFERLLDVLRVERDLSRTPLFQVMLVLQNFPTTAVEVADVRLEPVSFEQDRSDFDLTLWLYEGPFGILGTFTYSVALFEAAAVERFGRHLCSLLEAALEDPRRRVEELEILSPEERLQVLREWALGPEPAAGEPALVHRRVEAWARRAPEDVAVEAGGARLTYGKLDRRAEALAALLRGHGVGPEALVGVCVERSLEMVVALLGILKAGAAYVPLDPEYPASRLAFLIEDSAVPVLLTQRSLLPRLPGSAARVVLLDEPAPGPEGLPGGGSGGLPGSAAYVIYTSGSTGQPKGVVVEHRSIAAYTASAASAFGLGPGDRVLQFASISFDTSGEEIWPTLASGATLVLRPDDMAGSVSRFLGELDRLKIGVADLPTAFWHEVTAGLGREGELPSSLRLVILGGEKALPDRLALWRERARPGVRLLNTYGPTEATVVATRRDLTHGPAEAPIGRPIPGARAYVLGPAGEPVAPGLAGELHLGGPGLARGYLRRPGITAERFVPDPFSGLAGERLYRTGDLVRWRSGELEFLGRVDQQVKIRGVRVELEEIEAALRLHHEVHDAAVSLRRGPSGDPRLVACVVFAAAAARAPEETAPAEAAPPPRGPALRAFLRERLPEPMVPAHFLELAALPLTPGGKLDRRSLPEPEAVRPDLGTGYVAPQNELERTIAAVWSELLGVDRVGTEDNFFDLGAHSLLLVRAHGRLREALGGELTVIDLFRHPSVGALARHLSRQEEKPDFQQVQTIAQRQRTAQERQRQAMERLKKTGAGPRR